MWQYLPFLAKEQAFFEEKGFKTPKRCKQCRASRKVMNTKALMEQRGKNTHHTKGRSINQVGSTVQRIEKEFSHPRDYTEAPPSDTDEFITWKWY